MDESSVVLEWGKSILMAAMGLLLWYFKRSHDTIDKRLTGHDEDVDGLRNSMQQYAAKSELVELRESAEARAAMLDRDIKNLGQQLSDVLRLEIDRLRQSQERQNQSTNERLDKLLIIFTNSQTGQR